MAHSFFEVLAVRAGAALFFIRALAGPARKACASQNAGCPPGA